MPSAVKTPTSVNDYTILPLHIDPSKSFPQPATHYLYLRANAPKIPTADTPREVFVVNVPVDATEVHLRTLFAEQLGGARVERVTFELARVGKGITAPVAPRKKRKRGQDDASQPSGETGILPSTWDRDLHHSGSTATVTFVDRQSAELALREARRAAKASIKITWAQNVNGKVPALGRARYTTHQKLRYPPAAELQTSVDEYMEAFAKQEAEKAKLLARQRAEPDADGFVTVVRGGRTGPAREEETKAREQVLKQREKDRVRADFYRFQVRERKKQEAQQLVKNFERDREKVDETRKRKNKFRPN